MVDYRVLQGQFRAVRRAWKRRAVLAGLAALTLETVGLFTVAMLVDWLYTPAPALRVALGAGVLAAVVALAARHVLGPLCRRIPDERIALYIEEGSPRFEGAMMAAAELSRGVPADAAMVEAVLASATRRAGGRPAAPPADWRRLRKYGLAAMAAVAGHAVLYWAVPPAGHHATRVLVPWRMTPEDLAPAGPVQPAPLTITLEPGGARVLRGARCDVRASLSRWADAPVRLLFRPRGGQLPWRHIDMREIDRLRTFEATLQDINEDLEYRVAAGEDSSAVFHLDVYDPLGIDGVEIVTTYPEYMGLPPRRQVRPRGDVTAPVGSTVEVRVLANQPLRGGQVVWESDPRTPIAPVAEPLSLSVDPERPTTAHAAFTVQRDGRYTLAIHDVDGQHARADLAAMVQALPDRPPVVTLTRPRDRLAVHPLAEIAVEAHVSDDFGIEGVDLVYVRSGPFGTATGRMPLALERRPDARDDAGRPRLPDTATARARLSLEGLTPAPGAEEVLTYHLEARDRGGQSASSGMGLVAVTHFETWATYETHPPMAHESMRSLWDVLERVWTLHRQRDRLPEADFRQQSLALAQTMIDPATGALFAFYNAHEVPPDKLPHVRQADRHIQAGHQALRAYDTAQAAEQFQHGVAQLTLAGLSDSAILLVSDGGPSMPADPMSQDTLASIFEQARIEAGMAADGADPEMLAELHEAEQARQSQAQAEALRERQERILQDLHQVLDAQATQNPQAPQGPTPRSADLAQAQQALAEQTRQTARDLQAGADQAVPSPRSRGEELAQRAEQLDQAADAMAQAAGRIEQGRLEEAIASAALARQSLQEASGHFQAAQRERIERALAQAETDLAGVLRRQRTLRTATEALPPDADAQDPAANRQAQRLALDQVRLRADLEAVSGTLDALELQARDQVGPEAHQHIRQAQRNLQRGRPDQKMANAVVELGALRAEQASAEQADAEQAIERTLGSMRDAGDSLAADRPGELRRARRQAGDLHRELRDLADAPPDEARTRWAADLPHRLQRLSGHLDRRQFVDAADRDRLREQASRPGLEQTVLSDADQRERLGGLMQRIHDRLEAEHRAMLEAQRLHAAQREPCPPQYRALVNQYYQALSQVE